MKSFLTLSVLAATAALVTVSAAQAQTAAPLTRAEVQAELLRARAAGELDFSADEVGRALAQPGSNQKRIATPKLDAPAASKAAAPAAPKADKPVGSLSRSDVQAELRDARAQGGLDYAAAEAYGVSPLRSVTAGTGEGSATIAQLKQ